MRTRPAKSWRGKKTPRVTPTPGGSGGSSGCNPALDTASPVRRIPWHRTVPARAIAAQIMAESSSAFARDAP
jgi:hypothetical protein